MPRVQSLHHPTMRFPSRMQRRIFITPLPWRNVPYVVLNHNNLSHRIIVKGCIQAQVLRLLTARLRSDCYLILQQLCQPRAVVDIGCCHHNRKRHSSSITQNVVFDAWFCTICWVGTALFFPPTANVHKCRHPIAIASRCLASGRRDVNNVARGLQIHRRVPNQRIGHKRFARDQTLWASPARERQTRGYKAWRRGVYDHRRVYDRRDSEEEELAGSKFRFPPTGHQALFLVLA